MKLLFPFFLFFFSSIVLRAQIDFAQNIIVGAEQKEVYLPLLKDKKVAMLVNQTSVIKGQHLVDALLAEGINIKTIFAPEHGFRGEADAGEHVKNGLDAKTNLPIISLYGSNKKPSAAQLQRIDIVVFDIQDVGVRFYTYISSLQYMMEACAENNITLLILDRPNPNGFYVDGPVLDKKYSSFVGMQAIPIVHGMTVAEYAKLLNGEGWLAQGLHCKLEIVPCKNYDHGLLYDLPIAPSPNLRSSQAVLLYPSLCLFEGTEVSVGRGTPTPFELWGHPDYKKNIFTFTPTSGPGAKDPLYNGLRCYGRDLRLAPKEVLRILEGQINLDFIKQAYSNSPRTDKFFNSFFEKLAGNNELRQQIIEKKSVQDIRKSWEPKLSDFKKIRRKYLIYPDFKS